MEGLRYSVKGAKPGTDKISLDLVVLFVLEGSMSVACQGERIPMKHEDILLVHPGCAYSFHNVRDVLYGEAVFSSRLLSEMIQGKTFYLYANSARDMLHSYQDLRNILYDLTAQYASRSHQTSAATDALLLQLLDCLVEHYQTGTRNQAGSVTGGILSRSDSYQDSHKQSAGNNDVLQSVENNRPPQAGADENGHFRLDTNDNKRYPGSAAGSDERFGQMMQYVVTHITDEINLQDLADQMYVSKSTLSRIFYKGTGAYFSDYVNKLRLQIAQNLLANSDQNLTQIAMNSGFSNSAAFNRAFKKELGTTPSLWRQSRQQESALLRDKEQQAETEIRQELIRKGYQNTQRQSEQTLQIDFDKNNRQLYDKVWQKVINMGDLYLLTHANIQFHVVYLQEQLHYQYVRMWNVFSIKLQFSDGKTPGLFNFDGIDQVLDFLAEHHLKPFLDLSRRPDTALRGQGNEVYYQEEYVPFASRQIWESAVTAFLTHIRERYGPEEVSSWIFELSRDPHHFAEQNQLYADPAYDYYDAWKYFLQAVHRQIPGAQAGCMSMAMSEEENWAYLQPFFQQVKKDGCAPDFASYILFPYEFEAAASRTTPSMADLSKAAASQTAGSQTVIRARSEERQVSQMHRILEDSGLGNIPVFITEWNNTISNRNYLNDGCFRSAYLVQKVEELWGKTSMLGLMAGSDWISSYYDTTGILHGGIGLLTKETICKPAFYALDFLNQLGKYFVARGEHYIATVQENGDVYLLVFHFSWYRGAEGQTVANVTNPQNGNGIPDVIDLSRSRRLLPEEDQPLALHITLEHMAHTGDFYIKRRILNKDSGSILDEWGRFQYQTKLTREDVKYLRAVCTPKIVIDRQNVGEDHQMELNLTLEPEEVSLLHIYPAEN